METVCFSETFASTGESTRRQNPEVDHPHRRENHRSHKLSFLIQNTALAYCRHVPSLLITLVFLDRK
jgi:hypothetical protein